MRHLLRLDDWTATELQEVFRVADAYSVGAGPHVDGCAALFFPESSLRTKVTFERGASLMGLQPITFPSETLDKPEALEDVAGYLASWVDVLVVRHSSISILEGLAATNTIPVINAMTAENHPCEVLSDLYAISRMRELDQLRFLFIGPDGNIARAWGEAARAFGLDLVQCCPEALATPGARWTDDLEAAVTSADVIVTDSPGIHVEEMAPFIVTASLLERARRACNSRHARPFNVAARFQPMRSTTAPSSATASKRHCCPSNKRFSLWFWGRGDLRASS